MNAANLNIISGKKMFKYIIEHRDIDVYEDELTPYIIKRDRVYITIPQQQPLDKQYSHWEYISDNGNTEYIPNEYKLTEFCLYFPRYSVDTYTSNVKYILNINTWVNGKAIYVYSGVIDRYDAIAISNGDRRIGDDTYYECIKVTCADPYSIIYGDNWKEFRANVCEEPRELNNTGSNIQVTLCPVEQTEYGYIKLLDYNSAQSVIVLDRESTRPLQCVISTHENISFSQYNKPGIYLKMLYNQSYDTNDDGFKEYLHETYMLNPNEVTMKNVLIVKDQDNIYSEMVHEHDELSQRDFFDFEDFDVNAWENYKTGIVLCALTLLFHRDSEDEIMGIVSNEIFLTPELYKYICNDFPIKNINLYKLDMKTYNLNIVNKTEQKIINIDKPNDSKANIQKPIFVKVQDSRSIKIFPAVTHNIVINLDPYKSKVNVFTLKIGNAVFFEQSRTASGIVFKIVGTKLDEGIEDGIYYILDDNQELVTTGKYTVQ